MHLSGQFAVASKWSHLLTAVPVDPFTTRCMSMSMSMSVYIESPLDDATSYYDTTSPTCKLPLRSLLARLSHLFLGPLEQPRIHSVRRSIFGPLCSRWHGLAASRFSLNRRCSRCGGGWICDFTSRLCSRTCCCNSGDRGSGGSRGGSSGGGT